MYCTVDEAFDNSLRNQMKEYDNTNNQKIMKNKTINKTINNTINKTINKYDSYDQSFDNYEDIDIKPNKSKQSNNIEMNNNSNQNSDQELDNNINNINNINYTNNNISQEMKDDIDQQQGVIQYPQFMQSFFTAQGDLNSDGPYQNSPVYSYKNKNSTGTNIADLKKNNYNDNDTISLPDTLMSDDISNFSDNHKSSLGDELSQIRKKNENNKKNKKSISNMSHDYCVNMFVREMNDNVSVNNSIDGNIYIHIKHCKICKQKLNNYMKNNIKEEFNGGDDNESMSSGEIVATNNRIYNNIQSTIPNNIYKYISIDSLGYDLKEIMIIFLSGIVLVFILDLLVKIGRKTKK